jgi:hypothetical protein
MRLHRGLFVVVALVLVAAAPAKSGMDKDNPTCPAAPNWGDPRVAMALTPADRNGKHVLLAEGAIDTTLPQRMKAILDKDDKIEEIWLRSSGGNAVAGNETGKLIRSYHGLTTRIPAGWTCFSACNFVFMGGDVRFVEPGGMFMVHMFTHTGDRDMIDMSVQKGVEDTTELIGEIEQSSAILASADNDFLIRMGISRKLLTDVMYRQQAVASKENHSTRYCLSQEEVRKYNVMPVTN